MTDEGSEVRRLLAVLRERPHSVDPERTLARKARALPVLQAHVREVAARRAKVVRRKTAFAWIAAAAFIGALGVALFQFRSTAAAATTIVAVEGHLMHRDSGELRTVSQGDRLALPILGELQTEEGAPAKLETSEGLEMQLVGGSRLGLEGMSASGQERSVELGAGQIRCAVPKLTGGARFAVVTPNARVVVHGTRFTVRVDSPSAGVTRTCVRVTEGVVAVQHSAGEATLRAGDEWGCKPDVAAETAKNEPVAAPAPAAVPRTARRAVRVARSGSEEHVSGTLAEETALLQTALAAERKGQRTQATTAIMRLLSRYPDSPLGPEARAVLDRVSRAPAP